MRTLLVQRLVRSFGTDRHNVWYHPQGAKLFNLEIRTVEQLKKTDRHIERQTDIASNAWCSYCHTNLYTKFLSVCIELLIDRRTIWLIEFTCKIKYFNPPLSLDVYALETITDQWSKWIRQWLINWCISIMMIHKITTSVD